MRKFTIILALFILAFAFQINAQEYMRLDASFYSEALDEVRNVDIYLPSDYYINTEQEYATIYFYHGGGGSQNSGEMYASWYKKMHNQDTTISSPLAIFVCPDGSCEPYMGSMYLNSSLYGNFSDYMTTDVIEFVENNFRAKSSRNFRFSCGTSMGGAGSSWHTVNNLELYRANFPISALTITNEEFILHFRDMVYAENNSYHNLNFNAGFGTQVFFTLAGGYLPNLNMPYSFEIPWDSSGVLIDTVVDKWLQYDISSMLKDKPEDLELAFFLGCGTEDELGFYPPYLQFMDSLDCYNIPYDYYYFEGGHVEDLETLKKGFCYIDSIINYSYMTMGVEIIDWKQSAVSIYPNPFNEQFSVQFDLKKDTQTELEIFNHLGQKIKVLESGAKPAGISQYQFDVSDLQAGIYFCRIKIGDDVLVKKILKTK